MNETNALIKQQIRWTYMKRKLESLFSFLFVLFMAVFTIIFFAIPQTRAASLAYDVNLYGLVNQKFTKKDLQESMDLQDSSYNIFLNARSLSKKLASANFVNDKEPVEVRVTPFSLSVDFKDLFPVATVEGKIYLSNGSPLEIKPVYSGMEEDKIQFEKINWAYVQYQAFTEENNKEYLPVLNVNSQDKISSILPVLSELDSSFFPSSLDGKIVPSILKSIDYTNVKNGSNNGFTLHFEVKETSSKTLRLNVKTSGLLFKELTRERLLEGANVLLERNATLQKADLIFARIDQSTRLGFFLDKEASL